MITIWINSFSSPQHVTRDFAHGGWIQMMETFDPPVPFEAERAMQAVDFVMNRAEQIVEDMKEDVVEEFLDRIYFGYLDPEFSTQFFGVYSLRTVLMDSKIYEVTKDSFLGKKKQAIQIDT